MIRATTAVTMLLFAGTPAMAQLVPSFAEANAGAGPQGARASATAVTATGPQDPASGAGGTRQFVPSGPPPAIPVLSPERPLAPRERQAVAAVNRWRLRACRANVDTEGVFRFRQGQCEPTVVCAPGHPCDIAFEPGEYPTSPADRGDSRWDVHPRFSGTGAQRTLHLVVTPSDAGLDTSLVVRTDRRVVSIRLISRARDYMPLVAIDHPQRTEAAEWAGVIANGQRQAALSGVSSNPCDQAPVVPPEAFKIGSGRYSWRPVQVYAVGTPVGQKTCIEFSASVGSVGLPVLIAYGAGGGEEVISYRPSGRRFVVDGLLDKAALVAGAEGSMDSISIERRGYR